MIVLEVRRGVNLALELRRFGDCAARRGWERPFAADLSIHTTDPLRTVAQAESSLERLIFVAAMVTHGVRPPYM
jgi:hypothetical protein